MVMQIKLIVVVVVIVVDNNDGGQNISQKEFTQNGQVLVNFSVSFFTD